MRSLSKTLHQTTYHPRRGTYVWMYLNYAQNPKLLVRLSLFFSGCLIWGLVWQIEPYSGCHPPPPQQGGAGFGPKDELERTGLELTVGYYITRWISGSLSGLVFGL